MKKFIMKQELRMMEKAAEAKKTFMKKMKYVLTSKDGFTIIEILAITVGALALVALVVFVIYAAMDSEILPQIIDDIKSGFGKRK